MDRVRSPKKPRSKIHVQARAADKYWSPILVVTRIADAVKVSGHEDTSPQMGGVEALDNRLSTVGQSPVTEQEAQATKP
jgi:hypothetical protein